SAWPPSTPDAALQNVSFLTGTALDFGQDGKEEFVTVFRDANGRMRTQMYANDSTVTLQDPNFSNHQFFSVGAIIRKPGGGFNRLVVASRSATASMQVVEIGPATGETFGLWRTNQNNRGEPELISLAVGDLDGDGSRDDIVVAFKPASGSAQIVVLTPDSRIPATGSGSNFVVGMREIASKSLNIGDPLSLRVATGDLNGDNKDEIIYAQEQMGTTSPPSLSQGIAISTFNLSYNADRTVGQFNDWSRLDFSDATSDMALAVGDTDRDGLKEIVLGYQGYFDNRLVIRIFDGQGSSPSGGGPINTTPVERNRFENAENNRTTADELQLAVGDMDRDGYDDIVAAFRDAGNAIQTIRLKDRTPSETGLGLQLLSTLRDGSGNRANANNLTLALGDMNDDSLKAHYAPIGSSTLQCKTVVEPNITAAVFAPPYWEHIQANQQRYASIGESRTQAETNETAFTSFRSHSVSVYFGAGVDAIAASAKARITAGYEWSASVTNSGGDTVSKTTREGWLNPAGSFVVADNSRYKCYSYQPRIGGVDVDGAVRFCQFLGQSELAPVLDTWDAQFGPITNPDGLQWTPITRDWASLTHFRGSSAVQSDGNANASRAVDGNTDGNAANNSVSFTAQSQSPWWQVDLGSVQPISHVKVWNRTDRTCGQLACSAQLKDFYVFVSDVDPRTISNDPNVLRADSRVRSYFTSGFGGEVTNFLTLRNNFEPINGRFVRVQLAGSGVLSLAEVQVFSGNQIEPDRYPTAVRDPVPNDGWFLATIFNPATQGYEEVRVRGNLKWNGADNGVLANKSVGPGEGLPTWSLTQERTNFTTTKDEVSNSVRVGAQFDVEAGVFSKVQFGGSYEFTAGLTQENTRSISWGTGFEIGGGVQGFPSRINGQLVTWPDQCTYRFQPYYYEVEQQSSTGYSHRMLVVDYIVPDTLNRRTGSNPASDLRACKAQLVQQPVIESNFENGAPGSVFVISGRGFSPNSPARVELLKPGETSFNQLTTLTTTSNGTLSFVLTIPQNAPVGTYRVRVSANAPGVSLAQASQVSRELTLNIAANAPTRTEQPGGGTTVDIDGRTTFRGFIYLPLMTR
ncbi:MAG: discoidin domain-containing protein, partial [Chloroflexaceae bacterium]|nr:discoidin domain-containing protein [Chloroflexaceae bacterium]